jgi:hypothetical protein
MNLRALGLGLLAVLAVVAIGCGDDAGTTAGSVSKLIGPNGGTIELVGGGKVVIPPNALATPTKITVKELKTTDIAELPSNMEAAGKPYAFLPHGTVFAQTVKIEVPIEGSVAEVRPLKLDDDKDTSWTTIFPSTIDNGKSKLSMDTTSFSVIIAARPRRNSGVITLPDGAIVSLDASTTDAASNDAGSDASLDASADATTAIDASNDAAIPAPIQCDPMIPIDNNNFATYPVVAFTNPNGRYGVMWGVSGGGMVNVWDGTMWHPQSLPGADIYNVVTANDGLGNTYADWGSGRAILSVGSDAFGTIDSTRMTVPYGAGHNFALVGLPAGGAMSVWSEASMKSASATPSGWQPEITADALRRNEPDIAINANGDIAATWWTNGTNTGEADLTLALWNIDAWTAIPTHTIGGAIGGGVGSVRVVMQSNGDPYIFYAQYSVPKEIHGLSYSVSGGTWSNEETLLTNMYSLYRVVIDSSDRITLVGRDATTQQVQATRRIGGVWSTPVNLNFGEVAALKLDPNDNPVLLVIPPPQQSPTITRVSAAGTTWLTPTPTPIPVSNILNNMVDVAFNTTNNDMIVFSASYNGTQSLQASVCR